MPSSLRAKGGRVGGGRRRAALHPRRLCCGRQGPGQRGHPILPRPEEGGAEGRVRAARPADQWEQPETVPQPAQEGLGPEVLPAAPRRAPGSAGDQHRGRTHVSGQAAPVLLQVRQHDTPSAPDHNAVSAHTLRSVSRP
jgi:hypothetical protein